MATLHENVGFLESQSNRIVFCDSPKIGCQKFCQDNHLKCEIQFLTKTEENSKFNVVKFVNDEVKI